MKPKRFKAPKLLFKFDPQRQRVMKARGVDGMCFAGSRNEFEFDLAAVRMKPDIPHIVSKSISVKRQIAMFTSLMENPLRGHPIIGIGSFPTDLRAKMLAVNIMHRVITFQDKTSSSRYARKDYPLWHKVYGGFKDTLRDEGLPDSASMLILSNIDVLSTNHKIEKVRDILEMYSNIPRVVIVTGCCPMEFFANKLHLPMDMGFYMGADNRENRPDISVLDI